MNRLQFIELCDKINTSLSERGSLTREQMDALLVARELRKLLAILDPEWTDVDQALPEDHDIHAAHPVATQRYEIYREAMRLVGAKRSKGALVDLVNWLLFRLDSRLEALHSGIILSLNFLKGTIKTITEKRDQHEVGSPIRSHMNETLDRLRVLESHLQQLKTP